MATNTKALPVMDVSISGTLRIQFMTTIVSKLEMLSILPELSEFDSSLLKKEQFGIFDFFLQLLFACRVSLTKRRGDFAAFNSLIFLIGKLALAVFDSLKTRGDVGIFGCGHFLGPFFGFCTEILRFSVLLSLRFPVFAFIASGFSGFWQKKQVKFLFRSLCSQILGYFICFYFTVNPGQTAMWDSGLFYQRLTAMGETFANATFNRGSL